jgi:hypothetical protein
MMKRWVSVGRSLLSAGVDEVGKVLLGGLCEIQSRFSLSHTHTLLGCLKCMCNVICKYVSEKKCGPPTEV